jgi:hypothetical protein
MTSWSSKHVAESFAQWTNADTLVSILSMDIIVVY